MYKRNTVNLVLVCVVISIDFIVIFIYDFCLIMASSKVVRCRQESLPKDLPPSVEASSDSSDGEKDLCLEDFDVIKTIGKLVQTTLKHSNVNKRMYITCPTEYML